MRRGAPDPFAGLGVGRWLLGAPAVEGMVERGELDLVAPDTERALDLLAQSEEHLSAAERLGDLDLSASVTLLYEAARKAMTAVLAQQGLRPTRAGSHWAVRDCVEAQLGPNARRVVRKFKALRRRHHEAEYPEMGGLPLTASEVADAVEDARGITEAMRALLPCVGPWH